ncbi:MAG: hypothetical protein IJ868_09310 [Prevotella sp.]|nr:hypothetical protein [Prevotella sp.]
MKSEKIIGLAVLASMMLGCQSFRNRQMAREWEALNDTITDCSQKIQNIVNTMQMSGTTTQATQESMLHDLDSIERQMKGAIRRCAERNKDNELGKYIRENYTEE